MHHLRLAVCTICCCLAAMSGGCLFVSAEKKVEQTVVVPAKPEIQMSEEYIRSKQGDVLVYMPEGWYVIDVEGKAPADVVAVAVNPDYTLSLVVQSVRKNDLIDQTVQKEGVLGLARMAFEKRSRKTANTVRLLSKILPVNIGSKAYGVYEFTGDSQDSSGVFLRSRSAVFITSVNSYYECSLIPTAITAKPLPAETDIEKVFRSVLASIQY
ncbi:MAG: hypothetical protein JNL32_09845 [Candidatus Kapabacteria bacterium]|nr:hypothetical protein [Candidatus Kapabacteria bacterium]